MTGWGCSSDTIVPIFYNYLQPSNSNTRSTHFSKWRQFSYGQRNVQNIFLAFDIYYNFLCFTRNSIHHANVINVNLVFWETKSVLAPSLNVNIVTKYWKQAQLNRWILHARLNELLRISRRRATSGQKKRS